MSRSRTPVQRCARRTPRGELRVSVPGSGSLVMTHEVAAHRHSPVITTRDHYTNELIAQIQLFDGPLRNRRSDFPVHIAVFPAGESAPYAVATGFGGALSPYPYRQEGAIELSR